MPASEDEFDALPDIFEGVDVDSIAAAAFATPPPPNAAPTARSTTDTDHAHVEPIPLDRPEFVQGRSDGAERASAVRSPQSSDTYGFDDFDEAELAAADAIEQQLVTGTQCLIHNNVRQVHITHV
jgi:hypothetical protein